MAASPTKRTDGEITDGDTRGGDSASTPSAIDTERCPLCTRANDCALARGESTCWCFEVTIPALLLESVPDAARGRACICRTCAGAADTPAGSARRDP